MATSKRVFTLRLSEDVLVALIDLVNELLDANIVLISIGQTLVESTLRPTQI